MRDCETLRPNVPERRETRLQGCPSPTAFRARPNITTNQRREHTSRHLHLPASSSEQGPPSPSLPVPSLPVPSSPFLSPSSAVFFFAGSPFESPFEEDRLGESSFFALFSKTHLCCSLVWCARSLDHITRHWHRWWRLLLMVILIVVLMAVSKLSLGRPLVFWGL